MPRWNIEVSLKCKPFRRLNAHFTYRFQEKYNPSFTVDPADLTSHYSYSNQPKAALQNVVHLAAALKPLLSPGQQVELDKEAGSFMRIYQDRFNQEMNSKLGIHDVPRSEKQDYMLEVRRPFTFTDFTVVTPIMHTHKERQESD